MLKKDIKFEDFDGEEVTETHYFHIYPSEFAEFELIHELEGGLEGMFKKLQKEDNRAGILELFKNLICMGYGLRDPENPTKFKKTPEILADFRSSPAFDALYIELMTSETASTEFLMGAVPKSLSASVKAEALKARNSAASSMPSPAQIEDVKLPDDTAAWPIDNGEQPPDVASGLTNPRDGDGNLLPWAFREPTNVELATMPKPDMMDVYRRKNTDWQPFEFKS